MQELRVILRIIKSNQQTQLRKNKIFLRKENLIFQNNTVYRFYVLIDHLEKEKKTPNQKENRSLS